MDQPSLTYHILYSDSFLGTFTPHTGVLVVSRTDLPYIQEKSLETAIAFLFSIISKELLTPTDFDHPNYPQFLARLKILPSISYET